MGLVILDRDGVINQDSPEFVKSPAEWRPLPGSLEAIAALTRAGHAVAVATNQSGVARGLLDLGTLEAIHGEMCEAVARAGGRIAAIEYCPHDPGAGCDCRKPEPGMLRRLLARFGANARETVCIGDAARDLEAARRAGCRPVLVLTGKGGATLAGLAAGHDIPVYADLAAAARALGGGHP